MNMQSGAPSSDIGFDNMLEELPSLIAGRIAVTPRKNLSPSDQPSISYISPSSTLSIPKAPPRKRKQNARRGRTQIFTLTPVRNKLAEKSMKKTKAQFKSSSEKQLLRKNKPRKKEQFPDTSEENSDIQHDGESDLSLDEEISVNLGDFVIVKVSRFKIRLCINYY